MTKYLAIVLTTFCAASAIASPTYKNLPEYKVAHECALDSLKNGVAPDMLIANCIGNSHDPSKVELQAFKDARQESATRSPGKDAACTFGYAVYVANGSHADGFAEGPQKVTKLRTVSQLLPGREFQFFDVNGKPISIDIAGHWFVKKGSSYDLSTQARKTCSKQQIG